MKKLPTSTLTKPTRIIPVTVTDVTPQTHSRTSYKIDPLGWLLIILGGVYLVALASMTFDVCDPLRNPNYSQCVKNL
jgi:hypothetical protein